MQDHGDNGKEDFTLDEVKPEDGRLRYWMFVNGEQARLFCGLAAGFCVVLFGFLYFLGFGRGIAGTVLLCLAVSCFLAWWTLNDQLRQYEKANWRGNRSPRARKMEVRIAIGLWLFIMLAFCAKLLLR